jgi:hypothetical protein
MEIGFRADEFNVRLGQAERCIRTRGSRPPSFSPASARYASQPFLILKLVPLHASDTAASLIVLRTELPSNDLQDQPDKTFHNDQIAIELKPKSLLPVRYLSL